MSRHRLALMLKLPDNLFHSLGNNLAGPQSHLSRHQLALRVLNLLALLLVLHLGKRIKALS